MANEMKMVVTADSSSALSVLGQFSNQVKGVTGQVEGHFGKLTKALDGLMAPIAAITAALGGGAMFKSAIDGSVEMFKETEKLQKIMGLSQKNAEALRTAIGDVYGDVETFLGGIGKLTKAASTNGEGLKKMGIETRDTVGHLLPMGQIVQNANAALLTFREGSDRDAASMAVLGKSWQDWVRYLEITPALLDASREKNEALHLTMNAGVIQRYRAAMNDVGDVVESVKINVGAKLLPVLSRLGVWFSDQGPAAISTITGFLGGLGSILSLHSVQVGLLALVLKGPLVAGYGMATMAVSNFTLALAANAWAARMAGGSVLLAQGRAVLGMVNPWIAAGAAIVGVLAAIEWWSKRAERATAALRKANEEALDAIRQEHSVMADVVALEGRAVKGKVEQARHSELLTLKTEALLKTYPDLINFLTVEGGKRRSLTEAVRAYNEERERTLRLDAATQEAALNTMEAEQAKYAGWVASAGPGKGAPDVYNERQLASWTDMVRRQKAIVQQGKDALAIYLAASAEGGSRRYSDDMTGAPKANTYTQEKARLLLEEISLRSKATLAEQQANQEAEAGLKLEAERVKLQKSVKDGTLTTAQARKLEAMAEANYSQRMIAIEADFSRQRLDLQESLQGQLTAAEEGGLEKRLEAIRRSFQKIREENKKLGKDRISDEAILAAEEAQRAQARADQVKSDLQALKEEMANLAQTKGGPLPASDRNAVLSRYDAQGGTQRDAANQFREENQVGAGGMAGFKAGVNAYTTVAADAFNNFKSLASGILSGVEGAFANFFTSLTQRGATFGEKMKALWSGLSQSVVQSLSKIAAQMVVNWVIEKAKWAWDQIASAWHTKDTGKKIAENTAEGQSSMWAAAAGFFKAHAWIPWVGAALAVAMIALMLGSMGDIQGREHGGPVRAGTPYVVGEKRPELFVPSQDGYIVPSLDGLSANISRADSLSRGYASQGADYSRAAAQGGGSGGGPVQIIMAGAHIYDERGAAKAFGDLLQKYSRSTNGMVTPGGVLGGNR